jgi:hypothetical protein
LFCSIDLKSTKQRSHAHEGVLAVECSKLNICYLFLYFADQFSMKDYYATLPLYQG